MSDQNPALTPRFIRKTDASRIVGSKKLIERMLHASRPGSPEPWLRVLPPRPGTQRRDALIELTSVHEACNRLLKGDHPPLFPSEEKPRPQNPPKPRKKRKGGQRPESSNDQQPPLFPEESPSDTNVKHGTK